MLRFSSVEKIFDGSMFITGFSFAQCVVVLLNIVMISVMDYFRSKKNRDFKSGILHSHILVRWVIYFILIYDVLLFAVCDEYLQDKRYIGWEIFEPLLYVVKGTKDDW